MHPGHGRLRRRGRSRPQLEDRRRRETYRILLRRPEPYTTELLRDATRDARSG